VGITRAQKLLTLSYCTHRKRQGEIVDCEPSRFLNELPEEELEWPEPRALDPEQKKERAMDSFAAVRSLLNRS
jgi:ATP-dependent DNA helicase Rep